MPLLSAASSFSPQPICITLTYHPHGPHHLSTMLAPPMVPGHCPSPAAFFTSLSWGYQIAKGLLPTSAHRNYHVFITLGCCCVLTKPTHLCFLCIYMHMCEISMVTGLFFFSFSSRLSHSSSISPRKVRQGTTFTSRRDVKKGRLH